MIEGTVVTIVDKLNKIIIRAYTWEGTESAGSFGHHPSIEPGLAENKDYVKTLFGQTAVDILKDRQTHEEL